MAATTLRSSRAGISLLEVLISMFILAVGIVSVLSLFTAGREIRARAAVISRAASFADQMATTVAAWHDLSEWQFWDVASATFEWVDGAGAVVQLPVVIDPYGLNRDTDRANSNGWEWPNFADVRDAGGIPLNWQTYFRRITFPSIPRTVNPANPPDDNTLGFEETVTLFSDADAVEYQLPSSPSLPPANVLEFGRRKRGGDLSLALMIARQDWQSSAPATGVPMRYWLLVSHKQPRGYDTRTGATIAPQGSVKFDVVELSDGLIRLSLPLARTPDEASSVRRGLQPGRWLLLVRWHAPATGWVIHWTKMTSVMKDGASAAWLVVPEHPPEPSSTWAFTSGGPSPPLAFTFDSLMHVRELTGMAGQVLN